MKFLDLLEEIYWALSGNKVRSVLTILGIVIGIASVIALVAIGQGAQGNIQSSIQAAGANLVIVIPGAQRGVGIQVSGGRGTATSLTQSDVTAIQNSVSLVKAVAPEISRRYQVTAPGTNTNTQITGTVSEYTEVRNVQIDQGNFITAQQNLDLAKVAVLGPTARDDLFGQGADAIGQTIRINNISFKVIGINQSKGGSGFNNPDDVIYVPLATAAKYLAGNSYLSTISVEAVSQSVMASVQQGITDLLLQRHNISNPQAADFSVINQADIVATASSVTNTFTVLLSSIAGISLLVGGIGIMNMMLTTVTERTKEIGLRKAIGAQGSDINKQFLLEAVTLTFSGGVIGIALGWLLSVLARKFAGLPAQISLSAILLAFGVSAGIGIIFGYYPAQRASKLNPIEALRYE